MREVLFALAAAAVVQGSAAAQPAPAAADYSDEANWLCRPNREDACATDISATIVEANGSVRVEPFERAREPSVDCFYVYPTVSNDPTPNSDLVANDEERRAVVSQFARFGSVCRTFAPMYRQITLAALRTALSNGEPVQPAASALAYGDVAAAFRRFIEHDNAGRPFVLVGHSQGARMLQTLIRREIDGRPLQQQMLSALLIGSNLSVPERADVGGDFQSVALCRTPSQVGCVVSYVSFRSDVPPPPGSRFGVSSAPGRSVACTNPADLGGESGALLDSYLGARSAGQSARSPGPWVNGGPEIATRFVKVPGLLSARCVRDDHGSYLSVTVHADANDPRTDTIVGDVVAGDRVLADWGLHLVDVNLAQGNLIELVRSQAAAFAAR